MSLFAALSRQGLLTTPPPGWVPDVDAPLTLLRLCAEGSLEGGLTAALDVRPDELLGPLCTAIGGRARQVKVEDVRDRPPELHLACGAERRIVSAQSISALVDALNDWFLGDREARWVAVLGEVEDALALWCVPRAKLPALRRLRAFVPENG